MTHRGPVVVKGFHNSGRFDRNQDPAFDANVRRMRAAGRSFGTRTELSHPGNRKELTWPGDGWGLWHPVTDYGPANCAIEWDHDVWEPIEKTTLPLTDERITTKGGFLLPPSLAVVAVLGHLQTGIELEIVAGHMNLHNTPKRDAAWREEAATLRAHWIRSQRQHPQRRRVGQLDVNRTQRLARNRALVQRTMLHGTGMRNLWVGQLPPPREGTHGRAVLDVTFSDLPGVLSLLRDDASSDHRPYEAELMLAPRHHRRSSS